MVLYTHVTAGSYIFKLAPSWQYYRFLYCIIIASQLEKVMFPVVSVCSQWGPHVTITHDALDLITPTCLNLFNLDLTERDPPTPCLLDIFKHVHYEVYTVGKRAVCILLECILLSCKFQSCSTKEVSNWTDWASLVNWTNKSTNNEQENKTNLRLDLPCYWHKYILTKYHCLK